MRPLLALFLHSYCGGRNGRAAAERLVVSLSNHRVQITSNFVGEDLVLFGTVEPDPGKATRPGGYDLVVTVTGPRQTFRARRKSAWSGFGSMPTRANSCGFRPISLSWATGRFARDRGRGHPAATANRPRQFPVDAAHRRRLRRHRARRSLPLAFVRLQGQHRLYYEIPNAVTFLTPAVFRAAIPLPANAPTGSYRLDVKLFAGGAQMARAPIRPLK